jgi:hypothetical protein
MTVMGRDSKSPYSHVSVTITKKLQSIPIKKAISYSDAGVAESVGTAIVIAVDSDGPQVIASKTEA